MRERRAANEAHENALACGFAHVAEEDLAVDAAGPRERCVEGVGVVGRHDEQAAFLGGVAVDGVEEAAEGDGVALAAGVGAGRG